MKRIPFVLLALLLSGVACSDDSEGPKKERESDPVTLTLSDPNATEETKALYSNLWAIQSKGFMFGHHDDLMYGRTWYGTEGGSDTKADSGDKHAVYRFHFAEHIDDRHASNPDDQALRLRSCRAAWMPKSYRAEGLPQSWVSAWATASTASAQGLVVAELSR